MRTISTFIGSLAALALLSVPVMARNSSARPAEDKTVSSQCHSLQPGPDGSWVEIPCQELGAAPQRRPEGGSAEQSSH